MHLPIGWIPFIGEALEQLNLLIWVGLISVAVLSLFLFRTPQGLRMRSVGENPLAADTAGISPIRVRYYAVIASGAFAALGGVFLSIGFVHSFSQNMTDRQGLHRAWPRSSSAGGSPAARSPRRCCSASPARSRSGCRCSRRASAALFQALPYVLTLIAVAGLVGRSRPPAADGIPYERH